MEIFFFFFLPVESLKFMCLFFQMYHQFIEIVFFFLKLSQDLEFLHDLSQNTLNVWMKIGFKGDSVRVKRLSVFVLIYGWAFNVFHAWIMFKC